MPAVFEWDDRGGEGASARTDGHVEKLEEDDQSQHSPGFGEAAEQLSIGRVDCWHASK